MNKNRELIITGFLFLIAVVAKEFFQAGVWVFGSLVFFIVPGYWLLKLFRSLKIETYIEHLALAFPLSIAYLSTAAFLVNKMGIGVTYMSLIILAGLPCLVWMSTIRRKGS